MCLSSIYPPPSFISKLVLPSPPLEKLSDCAHENISQNPINRSCWAAIQRVEGEWGWRIAEPQITAKVSISYSKTTQFMPMTARDIIAATATIYGHTSLLLVSSPTPVPVRTHSPSRPQGLCSCIQTRFSLTSIYVPTFDTLMQSPTSIDQSSGNKRKRAILES